MQSQGSTSSQPSSFDSMSSSDSLLQSDSEQAEDDESVFLAGGCPSVIIDRGGSGRGGCGGVGGGVVRPSGSESPGSRSTDKEEEEEDRGSGGGRTRTPTGDAQRPKSQGDLLFAKKCAELQGFVSPLLDLLTGLKRGRFERGLTGFQQSVAMDRIQRIVGVLQRPSGGEKHLSTLLQVEMMLKMWFPHVTPGNRPGSSTAPLPLGCARPSTPPHKHKDQSHIPVKKRRLSWTDSESPSPSPVPVKRPRGAATDNTEAKTHTEDSQPAPALPHPLPARSEADREPAGRRTGRDSDSGEKGKPSKYSEGQSAGPTLTWVHVAPILSPSKARAPHKSPAAARTPPASSLAVATAASDIANELAAAPTSPGGTTTQDSSVTSTTPPRRHETGERRSTGCQSPSAASQQTKGKTLETCPRESPPPTVPSPPQPRLCPAPLVS